MLYFIYLFIACPNSYYVVAVKLQECVCFYDYECFNAAICNFLVLTLTEGLKVSLCSNADRTSPPVNIKFIYIQREVKPADFIFCKSCSNTWSNTNVFFFTEISSYLHLNTFSEVILERLDYLEQAFRNADFFILCTVSFDFYFSK